MPGSFLTTGYTAEKVTPNSDNSGTAVGKPLPVVVADEMPDVYHCSGHTVDVAVDLQQVQS